MNATQRSSVPDITFALTVTPEALPDDENPPCSYCNPTTLIEERIESIKLSHADISDEEAREQAHIRADYVLRFGHKDGAGVEVPVCDSCMMGAPVEHDTDVRDALEFEYMGDGEFGHWSRRNDSESGQTFVEKQLHPDCE